MDIFLLPHQDDEFAIFHEIEGAVHAKRPIVIVYLTDGAFGKATVDIRREESRAVLQRLGVRDDQIWFVGEQLSICNSKLRHRLKELLHRIKDTLSGYERIFVPAWEGGHPDHDAAALLAVALAKVSSEPAEVFQFPMYSSYRCRLFPYTVMCPVLELGPVIAVRMTLTQRWFYTRLCFCYRSQVKTFAGLMPFILSHYALRGTQQTQKLTLEGVMRRPHEGKLLYERRGWLSWDQFMADVRAFRSEILCSQNFSSPQS